MDGKGGSARGGSGRWECKGGGKVGGGEGEGGLDRSGWTREGVDEGQSTSSLVHPGGSKLAPLHQNFQILCKPSFETTTLTQRNVLKEDMLSGCKYLNPKAGRDKEVRKLRPIA